MAVDGQVTRSARCKERLRFSIKIWIKVYYEECQEGAGGWRSSSQGTREAATQMAPARHLRSPSGPIGYHFDLISFTFLSTSEVSLSQYIKSKCHIEMTCSQSWERKYKTSLPSRSHREARQHWREGRSDLLS